MSNMSDLRGIDWLNSSANRSYELRKIKAIRLASKPVSALCRSGVKVFDSDAPTIGHETRALVPGEIYTVDKIGRPGPHNRFSNLLNILMLDELPMLDAIRRGDARLIGPRGTTPEHRERLFDSLGNGGFVDRWREILHAQQHGTLSTYALALHSQPANPQYVSGPEPDLTDQQVYDEAMFRFESDERDFVSASRSHSENLLGAFRQLVYTKIASTIKVR